MKHFKWPEQHREWANKNKVTWFQLDCTTTSKTSLVTTSKLSLHQVSMKKAPKSFSTMYPRTASQVTCERELQVGRGTKWYKEWQNSLLSFFWSKS